MLFAALKKYWGFWLLSAIAWSLLGVYLATAKGHLDWSGHALGRDFVNYWTAGHLTGEGRTADIFEPERFLAAEHRLFDPALPFHFWSYPPPALLLTAPLGGFPYLPALTVWTAAGLLALIPATRRLFADRAEVWLLMLSPAVVTNIGLGQNGAFTAALMMGGLALWRTRPGWAGGWLGLLVFKPQIALLLPVAVFAERRWRVMGFAGATAIGLIVLSTALFGVDVWHGFFGPTLAMQGQMLGHGRGPFQWMMPSAFTATRLLGGSYPLALAVQAPFSLGALCVAWRVWRSQVDDELKIAVLMLATFVASPQAFNYDLIPAAAAALVLWRRDPDALSRGLALAVWALPAAMIQFHAYHLTLAPVVLAAALWRLYRLTLDASRSMVGEAASKT